MKFPGSLGAFQGVPEALTNEYLYVGWISASHRSPTSAPRPVYVGTVVRGDYSLAPHATGSHAPSYRAYLALAAAGFQRYATYRQAMVAAVVTNSVFGFLRFAVMLAVIGAGTRTVAGYDEPQLATFVWAGQGLIGVVLLWAPPELAERIRTGDVISRSCCARSTWSGSCSPPISAGPGYAVLTRFVGPVVVGALAFHLYAPRRPATYALFACSMLLATIVCFGCRYLVNAAAYWLLDVARPADRLDADFRDARRPLLSRSGSSRTPWRLRLIVATPVPVGHPDSARRPRRARLAGGAARAARRAGRLGRGHPRPVPLGAEARRAQAGDPGWLTRRSRPTAIWCGRRCGARRSTARRSPSTWRAAWLFGVLDIVERRGAVPGDAGRWAASASPRSS